MHKYEVGDWVIVKHDNSSVGGTSWYKDRNNTCGKVMKITKITYFGNYNLDDDKTFAYHEQWLEPFAIGGYVTVKAKEDIPDIDDIDELPGWVVDMDSFCGKKCEIVSINNENGWALVRRNTGRSWNFKFDWLLPYEEPKEGDNKLSNDIVKVTGEGITKRCDMFFKNGLKELVSEYDYGNQPDQESVFEIVANVTDAKVVKDLLKDESNVYIVNDKYIKECTNKELFLAGKIGVEINTENDLLKVAEEMKPYMNDKNYEIITSGGWNYPTGIVLRDKDLDFSVSVKKVSMRDLFGKDYETNNLNLFLAGGTHVPLNNKDEMLELVETVKDYISKDSYKTKKESANNYCFPANLHVETSSGGLTLDWGEVGKELPLRSVLGKKAENVLINDVKITVEGNKVTVEKGNMIGVAKCCPDDKFDLQTGIDLAMSRLKEKWIPKDGDKIYYLDTDGLVEDRTFDDDYYDYVKFIKTGNYFKTYEDAKEYADVVAQEFEQLNK